MGLHEAQSSQNQRHAWLAAGLVAAVAVALQLLGLEAAFAWDRDALSGGEAWRFFSGHLVHLGWSHLALNVAGLALIAWIVGRKWDWLGWLVVSLASVGVIGIGFWTLNPELEWYVGLSGVLHGLLGAGLVVGIAQRETESMVLAVLVAGKLAWEQFAGPLPGSEGASGGAVIVDAHLYGAVGGILAAIAMWRRVRPTAPI
jgi:rhomboid family GlyGly-CTERM serine protease